MVNGYTSESRIMIDVIDEILSDLYDESGNGMIYAQAFEDRLTAYGFMIVPIEDPTNLRFGVDE